MMTDYNWSCWKDLLFTAMDQCIPLCQSKRKSNAPWITKDLINLCRKKKSLYSKARKSANPVLWEKYRNLNNAVKRECNQARWTYIINMASELDFSGDSKPFWNYVKRKRNGTNNLVSLNVGDEVLTDDSSIASSLNSYFSSVFTTEDLANMPSLEPTVSEKLDVISCTSGEVMSQVPQTKQVPGTRSYFTSNFKIVRIGVSSFDLIFGKQIFPAWAFARRLEVSRYCSTP